MKKRQLLITLIDVACAIVCAVLAGCKVAVANLQFEDFSAELNPKILMENER